jgi:hypothetical protein
MKDLQDNEQLRRLVHVIVTTLLTGKLASLGFTSATPVSSQNHQINPVIGLYSLRLVPVLDLDHVLPPEASIKRAKQGRLDKRPCSKGCCRVVKPREMSHHLPTCSNESHAGERQKKKG